jgi:ABC-type transport system involved in multi-copper enzyme maturation permease subunit
VIEMARRFLRQKLGSPAMLTALGLLALLCMAPLVASGGRSLSGPAVFGLFVIAAASVSRDASSGALQMILARPIRRSDYLIGRLLGIASAFALFLSVTLVLAFVLPTVLPLLAPMPFSLPDAARAVGGAFLEGLLVAAVLVFFSTFLPGYADLLGYLLLTLLIQVPGILGQLLQKSSYTRITKVLHDNIQPDVPWAEVLRGENVLRVETGRYGLALTVFVVAALVVFSRREFAYGQD